MGLTIENNVYGTGWLACVVCGFTTPRVRSDHPRCESMTECLLNQTKAPGSNPVDTTGLTPHVRFTLDPEDINAIEFAVQIWQERQAETAAEAAILTTEILGAVSEPDDDCS